MPRARRLKSQNKFEDGKIKFLITGNMDKGDENFFWDSFVFYSDPKEQQSFWNLHKVKILKEFISKYPGKRPYAWWIFEAPALRKKLSKKGLTNQDLIESNCSNTFGIPDYYDEPYQIDQDRPVSFESQAAFLKEWDMLSKLELKRLKKPDFEPVTLKKR